MQIFYPRCCGLDVHKKDVKACALLTAANGMATSRVRTFSTMTDGLLALADWLRGLGVTDVAMESTGIYWRPVYKILEDDCMVILVNAQHIKAVPGRKTDVKDSEWLADLLRHGLLTASFIPPAPIRELRDLTRYRKTLVQERAQEANRLHKVLEGANIKVAAVATDVMGASGRAILGALTDGEQDAEALAELARGRLRAKLPQLRQALLGRVRPHQRILIGRILAHIAFLEESLAALQAEMERYLAPFDAAITPLVTLPGVSAVAAGALVAEIEDDMTRFPSAKHLASWAGGCPGNKQSGGKRLSGKTTKGNVWLRGILGEAVVLRMEVRPFRAQYHRLARRRGKQRAIVAVAHSILTVIYCMLRDRQPYRDLGAEYFDTLDTARIERHHVHRLEQLGYTVTLHPKVAA